MSIIYKLDHTHEEATQLLLTMLEKKIAEYRKYYNEAMQCEGPGSFSLKCPQGIDQLEDIILDDIIIGAHTIRIFDRFIIMDYNVIECDLVKGDIYVYNFDQVHDTLQEAMDSIQSIIEDAMFLGLYNEWDATGTLNMNILLHGSLLSFDQYNDVTLEEVDDILDWIGYNRVNTKGLH